MRTYCRVLAVLSAAMIANCSCDEDDDSMGEVKPADSGFDVKKDALGFENFQGFVRSAVFDIPAARRLFGDGVCSRTPTPDCILTPEGLEWSAQVNGATRGGLCEGFAALSHLAWKGDVDASGFGSGDLFGVDRAQQEAIDSEIAYWFGTQYLDSVVSATRQVSAKELAPILTEAFGKGKDGETFRAGIVRIENGKPAGGHALTPYAIEDAGDNKWNVKVYDSNHPGEERSIELDLNADTWSYVASTNPSEPEGQYAGGPADTNRIFLTPNSARTGTQSCTFCLTGET